MKQKQAGVQESLASAVAGYGKQCPPADAGSPPWITRTKEPCYVVLHLREPNDSRLVVVAGFVSSQAEGGGDGGDAGLHGCLARSLGHKHGPRLTGTSAARARAQQEHSCSKVTSATGSEKAAGFLYGKLGKGHSCAYLARFLTWTPTRQLTHITWPPALAGSLKKVGRIQGSPHATIITLVAQPPWNE
eukprot:1145329-Pelagomonas_calceolata.AAC.5